MSEQNCSNPISAGVLADYWLAALEPAEEEPVENHLLGCDACGDRLREIIAMAGAIRALAREGKLQMVVSDAFLAKAAAEGLRVRQYSPSPGGSVNCTVTGEDDLLIARLSADLSQAKRIDLNFIGYAGTERMRDIPVNPQSREIILSSCIDRIRTAPAHVATIQLIAVDGGGEHVLGEYTFNHSPSP